MLELKLVLDKPISGYWDGGEKSTFTWGIEGSPATDAQGQFVRIGSWEANHWFHVALGKTTKQTLGNAKRHLSAMMRKTGLAGMFEYVEIP